MDWVAGLARWFHYLAGVMWIGLLYYFNFVQVQALAQANAAADGSAAGITKFVAPRALQFFRWSALVTWLMGALLARRDTVVSSQRLRSSSRLRASASARGSERSCCSTSGPSSIPIR